MCLICIDLAKGVITATEGRRALGEMRSKLDGEHVAEVESKLAEADQAQRAKDSAKP